MPDRAFLNLISSLYALAVDPSLWDGWLARLRKILRAQVGVLVVRFERGVGAQGVHAVGLRGLTAEDIGLALGHCDVLGEDAKLFDLALSRGAGEPVVLSEVLPAAEFVATRLYREWLQPHELHHLVSLSVTRTATQHTALALLRRRDERRFAKRELDLLRSLRPHLERVVDIQESVLAADLELEVAEQLLDSLGCGVLLVNRSGRVFSANRRALALLERQQGLRLEQGFLRAESPRDTAALQRLVHRASAADASRRGGVLAVSRAGQRLALVVSVIPLSGGEQPRPWGSVAGALLLLGDPERRAALGIASLRTRYGLTEAEAGVALRIAQAESVDQIASKLGMGRAVVRSHLEQALAKTDTHRQVDLVRLLLFGHRALADPGSPPP